MNSNRMKTAFILTLTLFLAWAVHSEDSRPGRGKHTLWRISSGENTVYLVGSFHLLKRENYPLAGVIEKAFDDSQQLVFEVDVGRMLDPRSRGTILAKATLPEGESLENHIQRETYEMAAWKTAELGMNIQGFSRFKPWFLTMSLVSAKYEALGFIAQYGLDSYFYMKAIGSGKPVIGLETVEDHLDLLNSFSGVDEDQLVRQTLKDLDIVEKEADRALNAWLNGDSDELEATLLESFRDYPDVYERLVTERNQNWLRKIESFIGREDNYMVIVGAAHLVGEQGIVASLKRKGYTVRQL